MEIEIVTQETVVRVCRRTYEAETREEALRFNLLRAQPVKEEIEERRTAIEILDTGRPQESLGLEDR